MTSKQEIEYYVAKHFAQGTKHYGADSVLLTQEQVLTFVASKKKEGSMRYEPEPDKVWTYTSFTDYNSFIKERYSKPEKPAKTMEEIMTAKEKKEATQSNRAFIEEKAQSLIKTLESWGLNQEQIIQATCKAHRITKSKTKTAQ